MLNRRDCLCLLSLATLGATRPSTAGEAPPLMLAKLYRPGFAPLAD